MLQLENSTPFVAGICVFPDQAGADTLYVVIRGTFETGRAVAVASEQLPLVEADAYWGEPGESSLRYASDFHPAKSSTDIALVGTARPPRGGRVTQLDVALSVGPCRKLIRVFGDRVWKKGILSPSIRSPEPFESMPLLYERAFGGVRADGDTIEHEARNPLGRGFAGSRKKKEVDGLALPNLEDPRALISKPSDTPPPASFGFVAPAWEPRKSLAGTYDEAWQSDRAPLLPRDFDQRFLNAAHPDLVAPDFLRGGEPVSVTNASPGGPLEFRLPVVTFDLKVKVQGRQESPPVNLETVVIEPDDGRLSLVWRASVPCDKKVLKVETVHVGVRELSV